ncbi:MAG: hypothetical protein EA412_08545 [Chitinophagaceae bacterium]|nr:MAG: hypothetical protein EA412_08545 [Chitinophagaceae bacterium]
MFKIRSVFFKIPEHNRFNYDPRYYDPEKEDLEKRVRLAKLNRPEEEQEATTEEELLKIRIAQNFKKARTNSRPSISRSLNQSRLRFFIILGILLYLCYWILT